MTVDPNVQVADTRPRGFTAATRKKYVVFAVSDVAAPLACPTVYGRTVPVNPALVAASIR